MRTEWTPEQVAPSMPAPLAAQLDLDGRAHDIAPAHERMRLFTPAPAQLAGQTFMSLDGDAS